MSARGVNHITATRTVDTQNIMDPMLGLDYMQMNFVRSMKTVPKADAAAPKSDLHFLGGAYHFLVLTCLHLVSFSRFS